MLIFIDSLGSHTFGLLLDYLRTHNTHRMRINRNTIANEWFCRVSSSPKKILAIRQQKTCLLEETKNKFQEWLRAQNVENKFLNAQCATTFCYCSFYTYFSFHSLSLLSYHLRHNKLRVKIEIKYKSCWESLHMLFVLAISDISTIRSSFKSLHHHLHQHNIHHARVRENEEVKKWNQLVASPRASVFVRIVQYCTLASHAHLQTHSHRWNPMMMSNDFLSFPLAHRFGASRMGIFLTFNPSWMN